MRINIMEVKEIKIELKSLEETLNEFRDVWTDLCCGLFQY